eukprot:Tamp_05479.p2 GENE.Tamp_05479~~Tamp_05479.p2  ORF type:complete len:234 (+),score=63.36 Tamp_05479:2124-2825(+)
MKVMDEMEEEQDIEPTPLTTQQRNAELRKNLKEQAKSMANATVLVTSGGMAHAGNPMSCVPDSKARHVIGAATNLVAGSLIEGCDWGGKRGLKKDIAELSEFTTSPQKHSRTAAAKRKLVFESIRKAVSTGMNLHSAAVNKAYNEARAAAAISGGPMPKKPFTFSDFHITSTTATQVSGEFTCDDGGVDMPALTFNMLLNAPYRTADGNLCPEAAKSASRFNITILLAFLGIE